MSTIEGGMIWPSVPAALIASFALFALLEQFPIAGVTSTVAIFVIAIFFITSSDSGSYVIDMIASGGDPNPPRSHRVFWAISEGIVAAILLSTGGLVALQAGSVSTGLPFTLVLLVVMIGLFKGLRGERAGLRFEQIPDEPLVGKGERPEREAETVEARRPGGGNPPAGTA
jgi:choline/glycine/proline betaine transport protein